MKKREKWIVGILLSVNFICSLTALCFCCPRNESLSFDYIEVIIGILSLLVTILIGWNIFYALGIRKELRSKIDNVRIESRQSLKHHSELNEKDFNNIVDVIQRIETFSNKLDTGVLELAKIVKEKSK